MADPLETCPLLSTRVSCDLKDVGFQKRNVLSSNIVSTPPWLLMQPVVSYSLHNAIKADIPAEIHKHRFYELCYLYVDYCSIYMVVQKSDTLFNCINITSNCKTPQFDELNEYIINYSVSVCAQYVHRAASRITVRSESVRSCLYSFNSGSSICPELFEFPLKEYKPYFGKVR